MLPRFDDVAPITPLGDTRAATAGLYRTHGAEGVGHDEPIADRVYSFASTREEASKVGKRGNGFGVGVSAILKGFCGDGNLDECTRANCWAPAMGLGAKPAHARDRGEAPKPQARAIALRRAWPPQSSTPKTQPQLAPPTLP